MACVSRESNNLSKYENNFNKLIQRLTRDTMYPFTRLLFKILSYEKRLIDCETNAMWIRPYYAYIRASICLYCSRRCYEWVVWMVEVTSGEASVRLRTLHYDKRQPTRLGVSLFTRRVFISTMHSSYEMQHTRTYRI